MRKLKWLMFLLILGLVLAPLAGCAPAGTPEEGAIPDVQPDPAGETPEEETGDVPELSDEGDLPEGPEVLTDTGTYTGQVDSHSIEIRISGVQDESAAYRVFSILELGDAFEELELTEGMEVKFEYYEPGEGQPVLVTLVPMGL